MTIGSRKNNSVPLAHNPGKLRKEIETVKKLKIKKSPEIDPYLINEIMRPEEAIKRSQPNQKSGILIFP